MKWLLSLLGVVITSAALAQADDRCKVDDGILQPAFPLNHVASAISAKKLDIIVVGTSSSAPGRFGGPGKTYPMRLEAELKQKLPNVAIRVTSRSRPRQTAREMTKVIKRGMAQDKPALVIWQAGTTDAIRGVDPEEFRAALDEGILSATAGQADIVLMNMQFSPLTEPMLALTNYLDVMRFVALQHEIDLFDRYAVMQYWSEIGTFDFSVRTKKTDLAEKVHACIGRVLADFILDSAKLTATPPSDRQ